LDSQKEFPEEIPKGEVGW